MRGVVIVPASPTATAAEGSPGSLLGSPRDDAGNLIMLGTGQQHGRRSTSRTWRISSGASWRTTRPAVYYVIGDGSNPTVAEITEAAAVAVGAPGAVPGSDEEARARLGDYFAEVLLLDQGTDAAKARAEFDWHPSHPELVDEFRSGSYRSGGWAHVRQSVCLKGRRGLDLT